ncbi:MAG: bifunctional DNA-formamidopyrimidine glycosylase/DNA-(apurinic or apyrimidinic site) lyase [Proteobacteria bacterium]|nr:bifunctional DNA-formamidopyrimidine glycosylase/DNA-(apurinic or apyrimidinic site) lyase [Pseudomonadota bacterium]
MPELPEVETVRRGLENAVGKKIIQVFRSEKKLRFDSTLDLEKIVNAKISDISRRARYLIINFNNQTSLIVHLGMSGQVTLAQNFKKLKHDHFACLFDDETWLIFNDTRRFGFVDLVLTKNLNKHKMLSNLGPEPLSADFNQKYLQKKLSTKKMNIKTTMMDNELVVGVGNIYINESLFESGISPLRSASSLSKTEIKKLITAVKKTLQKAIDLGGSTISDYIAVNGESGYFQNDFKVYAREKLNCLLCSDFIKKIKQNGRSSFFCQKCQR